MAFVTGNGPSCDGVRTLKNTTRAEPNPYVVFVREWFSHLHGPFSEVGAKRFLFNQEKTKYLSCIAMDTPPLALPNTVCYFTNYI